MTSTPYCSFKRVPEIGWALLPMPHFLRLGPSCGAELAPPDLSSVPTFSIGPLLDRAQGLDAMPCGTYV